MMRDSRCALIFGINGQDGTYLARLLIGKNYDVHGTSRTGSPGQNLCRINGTDRITVHRIEVTDSVSVQNLIGTLRPDEIYYLAGQSSVSVSFSQPAETFKSHVIGLLNVLEALRVLKHEARLFNASSSEIFGEISEPATEENKHVPCTPYGVAKSASMALVQTYRQIYGLFACSGIMFNHESPLRSENFVSRRIIQTVIDISKGRKKELVLIETSMIRDWGWAPDFVECIWMMLQQDRPEDYVIATGKGSSLAAFVERAFQYFNLDPNEFLTINRERARSADIAVSVGNPAKAARQLGWKATLVMPQLVDTLIEAELRDECDRPPSH